jgi:hypothetical protein
MAITAAYVNEIPRGKLLLEAHYYNKIKSEIKIQA